MATKHPCQGRSKGAVEVFEQIAIGRPPPFRPKTIAALEKAGLIVKIGEEIVHRDRFGAVRVPIYEVPIPVHYQWCKWAAEQDVAEE